MRNRGVENKLRTYERVRQYYAGIKSTFLKFIKDWFVNQIFFIFIELQAQDKCALRTCDVTKDNIYSRRGGTTSAN